MSENEGRRQPSTLLEAIEIIRDELPDFDLDAWAAKSPMDLAILEVHFGIGMWIRNSWAYRQPASLSRQIIEGIAFFHEDSVSSMILEGIWRILNGEKDLTVKVLIDEQTQPYRDPGCQGGSRSQPGAVGR